MQSSKPSILCTGPVDETVINSREYGGVDIDIIPFTVISTNLTEAVLLQIRKAFTGQRNVVFTSSNAVKAVGEVLNGQMPEWNIFCIGNTTFRLAKKYFGEENIRDTASTASALAKKILPDTSIEEVTFFCGNLRRSELPDALAEKGVSVSEIIVYHTSLVPVRVEKNYDAVIFFSPSAAESFFSHNKVSIHTALFVMGKTTADAIKKYSGNTVITGNEPDKHQLLKQAVHYVSNRKTEMSKE